VGAVAHRVVLIPGDGTGPELTEATRRVLEATGVELEWDVREAGADVMERYGGNPLPPDVLDAIRETGVALKGPITTPVGGGFRSGRSSTCTRRSGRARAIPACARASRTST
jgi:isocitrate dehydrogenase (NAD+)